MAETSTTPDPIPPSQPDNPIPQTESQPQPQQPTLINPNPNPNQVGPPMMVPPPPPQQMNHYNHPPGPPSFRPAGGIPQFSPIPANPNLPPPGVTPQQHQQMYPGQPGLRLPFMGIPNGYMGHVPQPALPPPGVIRFPYPHMARPPFLPRPVGAVGTVPMMPRPPFLGIRPPLTLPIVRPPVLPIIMPAEKPQTTVYVGKIASSVENEFIRALLELCGPIKTWKRAQDPSDGTPRRFGFCEFETAEGVLRAHRLLSKCNVDGEELVLNVNQATRDYLERYVEKKKENLNKPSENGAEEAKKEEETATDGEKGEVDNKDETAKPSVDESKNDENEAVNKENDMSVLGLVTDEDREADREAQEKLTKMIEERIRTKPPPPPPMPAPKVVDGADNSNSEMPAKSGDKESDIEVKNEEKNDDDETSETKPASRAGTESPDRGRRYDNRSRDRERDRDKRDKERELDRLERERERDRARRERERDIEIQRAERFYKERVKEWESREKDKEYKRKQERDKEKDRERERRKLVADLEDESDDDTRKRRRKSEIEDKRRRRRREKEDDLADRFKEEEEIAEAKKRAEEEEQRRQQENLTAVVEVANIVEEPMLEDETNEMKPDVEQNQESEMVPADHTGDAILENGNNDDTVMAMASDPTTNVTSGGNAPAKKLGFGLVGSGKRTAVPSVFHEEEDDDAQKEKKLRPLVPIDYSTEEHQPTYTNDVAVPPSSAAPAESGKPISKEAKPDAEKERSRRSHDRSSHRDRDRERERDRDRDGSDARARDGNGDNRNILDAKQLIDMIPKTKDDLFSFEINWPVYDENRLHERMRPWISKKITEFLGEEETTLVEFIVDKFREHVKAETMLEILQQVLDEEAEMFVLKMWRMLIFEIKRVETGLAPRPGA